MNIYNKTFSASVVLIAAFMMSSCSQSPDEQVGEPGTTQPDAIDTTVIASNEISGAYVSLSSDTINVYEGETFTTDIMVNDFTTSEGGAVTLRFDPALLQVTIVSVDSSVWDFVNKDGQINNAVGTVTDIIFSSYQGVSGNAKVAAVEFKSISKGTSEVTIEKSSANPFAGNGEKMVVSFKSATVVAN